MVIANHGAVFVEVPARSGRRSWSCDLTPLACKERHQFHVTKNDFDLDTIITCAGPMIEVVRWAPCSSSSQKIIISFSTIAMTFQRLPIPDAGQDSEEPSKKVSQWRKH